MTETPDSTAVPVGDDWFDQWLETGTVAQRSVDVYGRPDLFAEYEDLDRKLAIAQAKEKNSTVERDLTQKLESTRIMELMETLYTQWMASKATWFMRALNEDEIDQIRSDADFPTEPKFKDGMAEDAKRAVQEKYRQKLTTANTRSNLAMIAASLVKIENGNGDTVKTSITVDELTRVREAIGDMQILRLTQAAMIASTQEPMIPVPLSPTNSNDAPSSDDY